MTFRMISRRSHRECSLETIARLNPHFVVLDEDEQDGSVPFVFLADAPRLKCALREILD